MVVVGGSLAGMAAAARLAKAGHRVRLLEGGDRLGGRWAPVAGDELPGLVLDAVPGVLTFPAPWRDLFKKSGRALDAELARAGLSMVPGPPAVHRFSDGTELVLPAERAAQHAALTGAYGPAVAARWRDLVDHLLDVWQAMRPLGMELELTGPRRLDPRTARLLEPRRTVADLAEDVGEPHLAAIIRSVASRTGSDPERTPALVAAELATLRTFGRWVLQDAEGAPVPSSRLVTLLDARLRLRRVQVDLGHQVTALEITPGVDARVRAVVATRPDGSPERVATDAVISAVDPWQHLALNRRGLRLADRFRLDRAAPALAPALTHRLLDRDDSPTAAGGVSEVVQHEPAGPVVRYRRRVAEGVVLESEHDHTRGRPDPSVGLAWRGWRSVWSRPPITTGVGGLWTAGPHSRGGNHLSQVLLSGALASYGCHDERSGRRGG